MDTLLEFDEKLGVVMSENERRKKHRKLGLCETCTNRLYIVKRIKHIPRLKKRIPVTSENVLNGRCLDCHPLLPSENKEEHIPNLIQFRHSMKAEYILHHDKPKHHKRHTINIVPPVENLDRSSNDTPKNHEGHTINIAPHMENLDRSNNDKSKHHKRHTINTVPPMENLDRSNNDTPKNHEGHTINIVPPMETLDISNNDKSKHHKRHTINIVSPMETLDRSNNDTPKHHKRHTINIVPPMETLDRSNNVPKTLGEHIDKYTKKIQEPISSPRKKEERNFHLIRLRHSLQEEKKIGDQKPREFSDELGISQRISSDDDQQKTRNSKNAQNHLTSCRLETSDLSNVENADLEQIITEMLCDSLTLNRKESLCKDLLSLIKNGYSKVEIIMSGGIMIIHNMMIGEHSSNEQLQKNTLALFDALLPIADDRILNDIPIVETITQLMVLHQTCLEIQQWSINCLRDLADRNERYKMSIVYSGAVDILNSVVSRFSSSPLIKREGHTLIANLVP